MRQLVVESVRDPGLDKLGVVGGRTLLLACGHTAILGGRDAAPVFAECSTCNILLGREREEEE